MHQSPVIFSNWGQVVTTMCAGVMIRTMQSGIIVEPETSCIFHNGDDTLMILFFHLQMSCIKSYFVGMEEFAAGFVDVVLLETFKADIIKTCKQPVNIEWMQGSHKGLGSNCPWDSLY